MGPLTLSSFSDGLLRSSDQNPCADGAATCNHVFDLTHKPELAELAGVLIGTPTAIAVIVVFGVIARWLLHRVVDRIVRKAEEGVLPDRLNRMSVGRSATEDGDSARSRRMQRARTMGDLLKSIITGVIVAVLITMILAELNYEIGPILASAGIVGVALGFGAQNLVKDFLSGIFMIFEDQLGVGDSVDLGEASGTVEAVSLRVTRLRDVNGTVWYVRNGEILRVGNMSQNWARTVLDVTFPYREDVARVRRVLQEVAEDLWQDDEYNGVVIEQPEVWGIEAVTADAITMRVTLKTAPLEQWRVAREMRARIKARFDAEGIAAPYAHTVVVNQSPSDQSAPEGA
ncbi:mechanosensitive ion channel family protein [Nocardioides agariphilus]|jgi:small conductance mechanosensitive channel|uniref:Mechanosensitive ion channel family protein n=1 Tax=Nocardioides agariphilus TaxID=433664 RepID=A0A930YHK0_9ACTN|nr:mechanosensitive ion channel family protein [Nocardioides agariphilus]MBF4767083.1 mechanosensitive ion channel family protein [Nocardioides agariphilus]